MNEVICPNCNKAFKIDESGYAEILKQIRDYQFEEEINARLTLAEREKENAVKLAEASVKESMQNMLAEKERQLIELKAKSDSELSTRLAEKETALAKLKSEIENTETRMQLAVKDAVQLIEKERDVLKSDLKVKELEKESLLNSLKQQHAAEIQNKEAIIKYKEEEIARVKEMRQRLSTKMLGETLEQHCEIEFNKLRATAFQRAYFEKDNNTKEGTKGDYIYREADLEDNEIVSIMFEMKNESDESLTKRKNEDFFAKLDKDRKAKGCEYAVLVSTLESDNDYYNSGIVDVSHKFEKMYVIRPQFFIPIITLLRNAALNSLKYKQELEFMRRQNIDITNFEDKINTFREGFAKNYVSASNSFQKAIEEIDKAIAKMEAVKKALTTSENQLRLANKKAEDLTIKKLTHNNPTMKQKFDDLSKDG